MADVIDQDTPLQSDSIRASDGPLEFIELGTVDYSETWHRQQDTADAIAKGEAPDQVWMLEHPSTYTAGKRTQPEDRPTNGTPVVDVDRGGRITWHGPGQLVAYPLVKLREPLDVVDYVRRIEEAILKMVHDLGLTDAGRVEGRSGVWLPAGISQGVIKPARKVAAIGIRVTHGVTMHGLAINVDNSLEHYDHIVACGIPDAGVTTLAAELDREISVNDLIAPMAEAIDAALSGALHVTESTT